MPAEMITRWSGPGSTPKLTIMYFDPGADMQLVRSSWAAALNDISIRLSENISWTIDTEGRELNTETGQLEGFWSDNTTQSGSGDGVGDILPDATQALIRWGTTTVIDGRRLQGRTFLPGLTEDASEGGNLMAVTASDIQEAMQTFVDVETISFRIWHRPVNGAGGAVAPVRTATVWQEFAVQRGRRG